MAADSLTGNLPTEDIVATLDELGIATRLDREALATAVQMAGEILQG